MAVFYILADYYNQIPEKFGRELNFERHQIVIDRLLARCLDARARLKIDAQEMNVRLYGGWYGEDSQPTGDRLQIGAILRDLPRRLGRGPRVITTCADGPLVRPEYALPATVRERRGLSPFRVAKPTLCHLGSSPCPVEDLDSWRRRRCPKHPVCSVRLDDVATSISQKLVDTMIVTDQIYLSSVAPHDWVATASIDDDVIPGVLTAAHSSGRVALIRIGRNTQCAYDRFLLDAGVQICDVEA